MFGIICLSGCPWVWSDRLTVNPHGVQGSQLVFSTSCARSNLKGFKGMMGMMGMALAHRIRIALHAAEQRHTTDNRTTASCNWHSSVSVSVLVLGTRFGLHLYGDYPALRAATAVVKACSPATCAGLSHTRTHTHTLPRLSLSHSLRLSPQAAP